MENKGQDFNPTQSSKGCSSKNLVFNSSRICKLFFYVYLFLHDMDQDESRTGLRLPAEKCDLKTKSTVSIINSHQLDKSRTGLRLLPGVGETERSETN